MERRVTGNLAGRRVIWTTLFLLIGSKGLLAATPSGGWQTSFENALKTAHAENRPILAAVTAVWCGPCRQMQQLTLNDAEVSRYANLHYVTVSIDGDQRRDLISQLGVAAFPTTLVLNPDGTVLHRWTGFQPAATFRQDLERFAGEPKQEVAEASEPAHPVSAAYPANASPFAFGGYCLVSLLDENILRRGFDHYHAEYRGVRLSFQSAEHRDRFLLDPERFWPMANGTCLVTSQGKQHEEPGDPRVGVFWKNRLWFFADRASQRRFIESPQSFSKGL